MDFLHSTPFPEIRYTPCCRICYISWKVVNWDGKKSSLELLNTELKKKTKREKWNSCSQRTGMKRCDIQKKKYKKNWNELSSFDEVN